VARQSAWPKALVIEMEYTPALWSSVANPARNERIVIRFWKRKGVPTPAPIDLRETLEYVFSGHLSREA
jgi:hypothetical protein